AAELAQQLQADSAAEAGSTAELARQVAEAQAARRQACELYNSALSAAREGRYRAAAEQLARAAQHDPAEPRLWQLKLKADLKARLLARCYADLAALDRLNARPPE